MRAFEAMAILPGLFLICCAFSMQYWTYRSHQELKKMNEKLDRLTARIARDE